MEFMLSGRSFISIKKRMGPNTEPWGTPDNAGRVFHYGSHRETQLVFHVLINVA